MEDGWLMAFHDLFRYQIPSLGGSGGSSDAHVALGCPWTFSRHLSTSDSTDPTDPRDPYTRGHKQNLIVGGLGGCGGKYLHSLCISSFSQLAELLIPGHKDIVEWDHQLVSPLNSKKAIELSL